MDISVRPIGALQTNCYILNKSIIVDPGDDTAALDAFIADEGADIRAILLTHGHYDHMMGCAHIKRRFGARLYVSREDEKMLNDPELSLGGKYTLTPYEEVTADGYLDEGVVTACGIEFNVLATAGHTNGSVCLIPAGEKILLSGDTLFASGYGRTDFPGGSMRKMLDSLRHLLGLEGDYVVYPGHGESALLSEIRKGYSL